jgi:Calx-beta domain
VRTIRIGGPVAALCVAAFALAPSAGAAPVVRQSTGADAAAITPARDAFRADVGGGTVAGAGGLFGGLRREINWDGAGDGGSDPNPMAANAFGARGVIFATPGQGFVLSQDDDNPADPDPDQVRYSTRNATYATAFSVFSPQRLFIAQGSTITDVNFFRPGTESPATTSAFGAVFTDVDQAGSTTLQYFDEAGNSLGTFAAPATAGDGSQSFLGVSFDAGERVARVRITSGNQAITATASPNDVTQGGGGDVVAMDDFLYGEPRPSVALSADRVDVGEAGGNATLTINRPSGGAAATVDVATSDGTAKAGADYTATNQTVNFADGETTKTVSVPVSNDTEVERDETVQVTLSNPTGDAALVARRTSTIAIADDESIPSGAPAAPAPEVDRRAPGLRLDGVPARVKRSRLLRGLRIGLRPDEAAGLQVELLASARRAAIARVGDLVLVSRSLRRSGGRRTVLLKPSRRLLGTARRFSLRLRVTATDASGNRRTVTRTIRVVP